MNTYEPKDLRFHFAISVATTALATVGLAMMHPVLPVLLAYDYFLLLGFTKVLNQTTFVLVLDQSKRHIYLNRLNFLGYMKHFEEKRISLRTVKFIGEYRNEYVTLDNKGLLPSISRLMNFGGKTGDRKSTHDLNEKIGNQKVKEEDGASSNEEKKDEDKNKFKYFWKFMAENETFLIPIDHEKFEEGIIDKQLLFDLINGRQNKILDYDFSQKEEEYEFLRTILLERYREIADKHGDTIVEDEDKKKRDYMYFHPNREFSGKLESLKLKKVDDGTFIDNGYR